MTRKQLHELMAGLARRRPIFHSEADFQHEFAWSVRERNPNAGVRLEYPLPDSGGRIHLDVWLPDSQVAVELKYFTRAFSHDAGGESFELANQGAHLQRRYAFVDDIRRLEGVKGSGGAKSGWAILLTNDPQYWKSSKHRTVDAAFRVHDERRLPRRMAWSRDASPGTKRGQESPIVLGRRYTCRWRAYGSKLSGDFGRFRYLAIRVGR